MSPDANAKSRGSLRTQTEPNFDAKKISRAQHATANTLSNTADYIRKNDAASMWTDAKRLIKDNPGLSLLGGAIVGFALARLWTRD